MIHIFWASRYPGDAPWTLWHTLLDIDGNLLGSLQAISPRGENVGRFAISSDNQGGAVAVWDQDEKQALRFQHITASGAKSNHTINLGVFGTKPSVSVDTDQIAHISWLDEKDIAYAQIDLNSPTIVEGTTVSNLNASGKLGITGDTFDGPALGYADGWVYIFWSILSYSDVDVGTAAMEFISFSADQPQDTNPEQLWMLAIEDQPLQPYSGDFAISEFSPAVDF